MWYLYFLELADGNIYVGSTNNLRRRIEAHNGGRVRSTKAHLPIKLISYVAPRTQTTARELEHYFKSGSSKAFANKRLW